MLHFFICRSFSELSTQDDVFQSVGLPQVMELLSGQSSTLFMYGISGSEKTYTMNGTTDNAGIVTRTIQSLFHKIQNKLVSKYQVIPKRNDKGIYEYQVLSKEEALQKETLDKQTQKFKFSSTSNDDISNDSNDPNILNAHYYVSVLMVQVYNEKIYDLLHDDPTLSR